MKWLRQDYLYIYVGYIKVSPRSAMSALPDIVLMQRLDPARDKDTEANRPAA